MVVKLLAWSTVVTAILFVVLALTALFAWESLGDTAGTLVWYGAIPLIVVSILLALTLLAWTVFQSGSDEPKG
jgi:uncharacterized sodium:solute symporter family permease YidK